MAENNIANIMRDYVKTMAEGDVEKMLSLCTEDIVNITPYGTFRGKEEVRRSSEALSQQVKNMKVTETGNGIIVEGNKAFFEHIISGVVQGNRFEVLAFCAYEFSGDKIKEVRTAFDRLLMAKQVVTGWPARSLVNFIVKQTEKGMH